MKKIIVVVLLLLVIVFINVLLFHNSKRNQKVLSIKSLNFYYSQWSMANSGVRYELNCKGDCTLLYKAHGVPFDNPIEYKVDKSTVLELEKLLNKYEVFKWNGFNKTDNNVLDGDSFSFSVVMGNDDIISASGYMKWPIHYWEVKKGLDTIFAKVIK